jgi:hypothetical protein
LQSKTHPSGTAADNEHVKSGNSRHISSAVGSVQVRYSNEEISVMYRELFACAVFIQANGCPVGWASRYVG